MAYEIKYPVGGEFPLIQYGTGNVSFDLAIQAAEADRRLAGNGNGTQPGKGQNVLGRVKKVRCELSGVAKFTNPPKRAKCPSCGNSVRVRRPSGVISWHSK